MYKILSKNKASRLGVISTAHGEINTPAFVPVGTQATVKGLISDDLDQLGSSSVLANTYHLYLRPGNQVIKDVGGLHKFMNYHKPIWTDSGGFQVFSLGIALEHGVGKVVDLFSDDSREEISLNKKLSNQTSLLDKKSFCKVDDEGVTFMSHLDGTLHRWTAEKSMEVQSDLGADLIFAMDECTSPTHDYIYTKQSMYRSHDWENRSLIRFGELQNLRMKSNGHKQYLYGIVQGGEWEDLRIESAKFVSSNNFDGVGVGGALVSKSVMKKILEWINPLLIDAKPRHLLGIGGVDDIFTGVEWGMDTFDCAHPTRIARRGHLLISPESGGSRENKWRVSAGNPDWVGDISAIDKYCDCYVCKNFSRAYIRHLYWAQELTYYRLASIHNLRFMMKLLELIRDGLGNNYFDKIKNDWLGE